MTYLITGGTGFIGSYVTQRLVERGDRVVVYARSANTWYLEQLMGKDRLGAVTVVRGDILDLAHLCRTARQYRVEAIIHLAYMPLQETQLNPTLGTRINCEGTNNVYETACSVGARRVVWASSITVFGARSVGPDGVVANDAPYDPTTIYGACKVVNELTARRYALSEGLEPIGLRFPAVYGAGTARGWASFVCRLIESLVKGGTGQAPVGDQRYNWTFVEDIAEAVVLATDASRPRTLAFTLGSEVKTTREVVETVLRFFPGAQVTPLEEYNPGLPARLDSTPAREELGWQPHHTLEDGILRTINFFRCTCGLPPL